MAGLEQSHAVPRRDRLQTLRVGGGPLERRDGGFVVVERDDPRPFGKPQRKWADAGEKDRRCFGRVQ